MRPLPNRSSRTFANAFLLPVGFALLLILNACGGGGSSTPTINDLTILPGTVSVPQSGTAQFSAFLNGVLVTATWKASSGNITASGFFTAPNSGTTVQVTATSGSNTGTVNVNISAAQPLAVSPAAIALPAGQVYTFSALSNGQGVAATWSVSATGGGNPGTIDNNGNYTPPLFPPPGQTVTVTAQSGGNVGTSNVLIIYSNASINGTYSFAYTGDDGSGFFSAAGSISVDGNGNIGSGGVEDVEDLGGVNSGLAINGGSYSVGPNGLTQINFTTSGGSVVLEAALTTNLHGLVIRYDNNATGSGTIDQQNPADLQSLSGPYVFSLSGADVLFDPLGLAGKFSAANGSIPNTNAIVDINDGGIVNNGTQGNPGDPDTSLNGSYSFDQSRLGSGRGIMVLSAANFVSFLPTGTQATFAYYVVDNTHFHLVEVDGNAFTAGDAYVGLIGPNFGVSILPKGNYAFNLGGTSLNGAYAAGGVYSSDGDGNVSGGVFDNNDAGKRINQSLTLNKCAFTVDPATGRVDMLFGFNSGCSNPSVNTDEFAVYATAISAPSSVMLEIDSNNFLTTGVGYAQQGSSAAPTGTFAFNLTGQGIFHNQAGSYQQDALGQIVYSGTAVSSGNMYVNNYGNVVPVAPVTTSQSSLGSPSGFGRGTMKLTVDFSNSSNGTGSYSLVYYYVGTDTYLLIDLDTNRIANGVIADQY